MEQQLSGPMKEFKLQAWLDVANVMVNADEVLNALWLLEKGIPGWYRDNTPKEISNLKNEIQARLATASFYATDAGCELLTDPNMHLVMKHSVRGDILDRVTKYLNKSGFRPKLYDLGPGEFVFVKMLMHEQADFSYYPIYVNHPTYEHYKKEFEHKISKEEDGQPKVFFACEILEHLQNPHDLRYEMMRHCRQYADVLEISTPMHTWDVNCTNWRASKPDLGHLRTFTPSEFIAIVQEVFPEYNLTMFQSQPMHIHGTYNDSRFECIKDMTKEIFK